MCEGRDARGMRAVPPVYYSSVYNKLYKASRRRIDKTITTHLSSGCTRTRHSWASHLHTILRSQTLGTQIRAETARAIVTACRLHTLERMQHIRRIQRAVVRWLWRPAGPLARRCAGEWNDMWA